MTRDFTPWLVIGLLIGLCFLPLEGHGGVIRGTLRLPPDPARKTANRTVGDKKSHAVRPAESVLRGALRDAVIYVEQVPPAADSALAAADTIPATLAQKDRAFVPRVLSIAAGDTVVLPNLDPVYHDVFSLSPIKNFELGRYPGGQSKRVVFDRPGLVNVYCGIHSNMAAFVLVLPHHVFARADESGAFALPPLPPGHYTVCVWHPDLRGLRRDVRLEGDADVVLDLSL